MLRSFVMTRTISVMALTLCLVVSLCFAADNQRRVPTIDDLLTLKTVGGTQISPDGKWIAYTISNGDFKQDAFVTHIWLVDVGSGRKLQLTRGDKSSGN